MKYSELKLERRKSAKRVGRGIAAGQGKTAGRGTKGQKSRTGSSRRPGFEGGQNPLTQRLPKLRGFNSHRTPFDTVFTGQLEKLKTQNINNHVLAETGLVDNPHTNVKLLVKGSLTKKMEVNLQGASAGAIKAVEKAGGKFLIAKRIGRTASKKKPETK